MTSTTLTIEATNADSAGELNQSTLIKTDRLGRIRVTPQHREALLDKFEQNGMSGQQFAKLHGIKYTTFAVGAPHFVFPQRDLAETYLRVTHFFVMRS